MIHRSRLHTHTHRDLFESRLYGIQGIRILILAHPNSAGRWVTRRLGHGVCFAIAHTDLDGRRHIVLVRRNPQIEVRA